MNAKSLIIHLVMFVLMVVLISACGSPTPPSPIPETIAKEPTPIPVKPTGTNPNLPVLEVTFNGTECKYLGPDRVPQGKVSIVFINQTEVKSGFGLVQFEDGYTWEDFMEYLGPPGSEHSGIPADSGGELFEFRTVPAGETKDFGIFLIAGDYGIYCTIPLPFPERMWSGAPFAVEN